MLGVERVGAKDSFFDLGGHSLLAVQAHREIRETCGAPRLAITDIFRFPTLGGLSERVRALSDGGGTPAEIPAAVAPPVETPDGTMSKRREMRARRRMARA
ncbi:phosphopantetheine-binding protein [Phycobium rhodophyticola]